MDGMMERFNKRKKIIESNDYQSIDIPVQENDKKFIEQMIKKKYQFDFTVTPEEAADFLEKFKKDFNDQRFKRLVTDCQKEVINNIVIPFGLGKIVAAYDKTGGNVTTIHNANKKIYANQEDEYIREDYTNTKNSNNQQFAGQGKNSVGSNFTRSRTDTNGNVEDAYTDKTQRADTTSPDHIVPLSQYHKNGGYMQDKRKKSDFATDEDNLALTDRSINQSMRDFEKKDWSEKETTKGIKNKDKFEINGEKLNDAVKKGEKASQNHLPTDKEKAQYYTKKATLTGIKEGAKMGMQQAIGLVLVEFFTALFDEIIDIYKNGFDNGFKEDKFLSILTSRLKRIGERITSKWKDVAIAFKDGAISGFISNIITTLTNAFVTTAKRTVRIIREGIFSLYRAVKLLLFPPEGMTFSDAMHEAKKLIASGIIISIGVVIEQYVDAMIKTVAFLEPFADIVTSILIGSITGLTVILVAYYIEKKKNDKDLFNNLVCATEKKFEEINKLLLFDDILPETCKVVATK
jgi:hypothetical protein